MGRACPGAALLSTRDGRETPTHCTVIRVERRGALARGATASSCVHEVPKNLQSSFITRESTWAVKFTSGMTR